MKKAITPRRDELLSGIRNAKPAASRVHAICGNVKSNNERLPKVSIVKKAGMAKTKLTIVISL